MAVCLFILALLTALLAAHEWMLHRQIRSLRRQLKRQNAAQTPAALSLALIDPQLNGLAEEINLCLGARREGAAAGVRREKEIRHFFANLSHDLRTPLTTIKGYLQLLAKEALPPGKAKNYLQVAQRHTRELGGLIEQFFEASCLWDTEKKPEFQRVNLSNLAAECTADFVPALEERGLRVTLACEGAVLCRADREMTVRILQNLLRNCLLHAGGDISLTIRADGVLQMQNPVNAPWALDAGRLFDRFYAAGPDGRGGGLGLSIVKLLAEQMGGAAGAALAGNLLTLEVRFCLWKQGAASLA